MGSSTPVKATLSATAVSWPQKIKPRDQVVNANLWPTCGQSLGDQTAAVQGFSAPFAHVAHGTDQHSPVSINCVNSEMDGNVFLMARHGIWKS
jgi:hypothetical protein